MIICDHCGEEVFWSRFTDRYVCLDCQTDDVTEVDDEPVSVRPMLKLIKGGNNGTPSITPGR